MADDEEAPAPAAVSASPTEGITNKQRRSTGVAIVVSDDDGDGDGDSDACHCCSGGIPCWRPAPPQAEQLELQRQALLALEESILTAQWEVSGLACA